MGGKKYLSVDEITTAIGSTESSLQQINTNVTFAGKVHREIHEGENYTVTTEAELASGSVLTIILETPSSGTYMHVVFQTLSAVATGGGRWASRVPSSPSRAAMRRTSHEGPRRAVGLAERSTREPQQREWSA